MEGNKGYLKLYTRQPDEDSYPWELASSVHMSYSMDGKDFTPLNRNYGILFAKACIGQDNTIMQRGIKNPRLFSMGEGWYGIVAAEMDGKGNEGNSLLWKTMDFIAFEGPDSLLDEELVLNDAADCIEVEYAVLVRAAEYWSPVSNTEILLPECIEIKSVEELRKVRAVAVYSDGSSVLKKVRWDETGNDLSAPGIYEITGRVADKKYPFPLASGYGDPVVFQWEGKWYYISTNDNVEDIGLYVREADTVAGLFAEGVEEHLILAKDESRELIQTFWAPEFHEIGGELYLLFAVSGYSWNPQCHIMKLKKGHSIIDPESWEDPIRVRGKDGGYLSEKGITLDMTFIKTSKQSYMVWSYREYIGKPLDTGSMLCIATVDEGEPWKLTSNPVLLSRPLFGWENVSGTINNEGPCAFLRDGNVYLTYSGGSANGYTYSLGLLTACEENDLLDISVWKKRCTPVLSFYSVAGQYGPGHNSFFVDEDGDLMIAYHGETERTSSLRCNGIRRVHFRKDGSPEFGMSAKEDLNPALSAVRIKVHVMAN